MSDAAGGGTLRAAIIAIGSEMLGTVRLDTNSLRITALLERYGVELARKSVIGDIEAELVAEIAALVGRFDLVVISGGLGPTSDDVTRPALAAALGRTVRMDEALVAVIAERFARLGLVMPEVNRRQAEVLAGATALANPRGSAPGMYLVEGRTHFFLFPGVPTELEGLLASELEPWLARNTPGIEREAVVLKVACMSESALEELVAPAYEEFGREAITVLAKPGEVEVHAFATGEDEARRNLLLAMRNRLAELIGPAVFTDEEGDTLEAVIGRLLAERGRTLATAESCTGGLVAERVTRVPGSSGWYVGGAVSYSNELKVSMLGVSPELITRVGAVSQEVARAMAEGARLRFGADYALSLTGIAGPGGGTVEKPVGRVHLALATPEGTEHRQVDYRGDRQRIRWMSSQVALELLRRHLLGLPEIGGWVK